MTATLVVERVSIRRGTRTVIDGLSMAVETGELVGVVGPNGCGKSTLLTCIAGVLAPRDGRITIDGASVWGAQRERVKARTQMGYVPEGADAPGFLRASELWALCAAARGVESPGKELRDALGLDELADLALERMSLGQRRRACLGAALLGPPKLLVLDEPDNGLDVQRLAALADVLKEHAENGGAVVLASHDAAWLDVISARRVTLGG